MTFLMRRAVPEIARALAHNRSLHTGASGAAFRSAGAQGTLPLRTGRERLVILGTGWGGARLARDIDPTKYDITVLSPRNHMVFTPLLAR